MSDRDLALIKMEEAMKEKEVKIAALKTDCKEMLSVSLRMRLEHNQATLNYNSFSS